MRSVYPRIARASPATVRMSRYGWRSSRCQANTSQNNPKRIPAPESVRARMSPTAAPRYTRPPRRERGSRPHAHTAPLGHSCSATGSVSPVENAADNSCALTAGRWRTTAGGQPVRWFGVVSVLLALGLVGCSGQPKVSSPRRAGGASTTTAAPSTTTPPLPEPGQLTPLVEPALPGEGQWQGAGDRLAGGWAIYTTQLRPSAGASPAGIAWVNAAATTTALYAGTSEPHGTWSHQGQIAGAQQPFLLGAFNGGFRIYDYQTGWYADGHAAVALQPGKASFVIFTDGTPTVADWGRDVQLGPNIVAVRQNLDLLVDGGVPVPTVASPSLWGGVFGGGVLTWRSGVGVTVAGDLVYAAGPALDPASLAHLLVAAGAVRAMELDINHQWIAFATYTHGLGVPAGVNLLSSMDYPPSHFLAPFPRDFFAIFAR